MENYLVQSPVLLMIFNRPDTTLRVFNEISAVKPARLYISADGPRPGNAADVRLCDETRSIVERIDWVCELKTYFRTENAGCKNAVAGAISWFFDQEPEGIILEDDCLPARSFFYFCDDLLARFRHDQRICSITGTNLQMGNRYGKADYYFSQFSNVWGWASWRRVWLKYDPQLGQYSDEEAAEGLQKIFPDRFLAADLLEIFQKLKRNEVDTWDYQFQFLTYFENGLCATPNVNLISNIGFREDATHTNDPVYHRHHSALPTAELTRIRHPKSFIPEKDADYFFLKKEFYLEKRWKEYNKFKNRVRRWWK